MSEWNLSVRLSGQGSDLTRALREASREARSASRNIAALRRDITQLRADAARPVRLTFDLDSGSLDRDIARARTRMSSLSDQNSQTARTLHQVARAARGAGDDLGHLALNATAANVALRRLNTTANRAHGRFGDLSTNARTLRGDLDDLDGSTRRLGNSLGGLRGRLGTVGSAANDAGNGFEMSGKELMLLATALAPVAAAAVPVAQALAAAGVGAGAFGVAIAGQIGKLSEAAEAEKKYQDAVSENGKNSAEAVKAQVAYQKLMAKMPPATREAAAAFSSLKTEYKGWSDSLASSTMPVATHGLQVMSMLLPHLTPMVKGAATEFDRLMKFAGGAINTPGFDRLMEKLSGASTEALHHIVNGIVDLVQAAENFSGGGEMAQFLDYCRQNGPLVAETLKNLATAAVHLLTATADSGVSILTLVNALAKLVNAVPTSAISTFLQLYTALKLVKMGAAAVAAVTGSQAATSLASFVRSARFGGVGPAIVGVTQRMSTMTKVAGGLGVLGAVAIGINELAENARGAPPNVDKLTTSLKDLATAGKFTGELRSTFGDMDGFITKLKTLDAQRAGMSKVKDSFWAGFVPAFDKIAPKLDDLANGHKSMGALSDDFKSMDQSLSQLATNGHADVAAAQFKKFEAAMRAAGYSTKDIKKIFPDYTAAVAGLKAEQDIAAQGMGAFGQEAISTSTKLNAQKQSADGLRLSLVALNDVSRSAMGGMIGFEQAIDDTSKAAHDNAKVFGENADKVKYGTDKQRTAAGALQTLADKTDAATTSARENGESWETVDGIYKRGRKELVESAVQMGLNRGAAERLADSILRVPTKKSTEFKMRTEDAVSGLNSVIDAIKATPDAKSVKVDALTQDAIGLLKSLGFKVEHLKNGQFKVTALTGSAIDHIGGVQAARDALKGKSIKVDADPGPFWSAVHGLAGRVLGTSYINVAYRKLNNASPTFKQANGGVMDFYAAGGFSTGGERHVAQIAPAGSWRVWAEDETGGESYIPLSRTKRPRSRKIAEETVRRLGGDPSGIAWYADGGMNFSYQGTGGSASKYTLSGLISASNDKKGNFSLSIFTSKLRASNNALDAWRANLAKVASRAGQDVADALAEMGDEGIALTKKMATGSTKYVKDMAAQLRNLSAAAKASLSEYTSQLNAAVKDQATFQRNLATLAGQGYGALAGRLAGQNDQDAEALAAAAVKDKKKASSANKAAASADNALSGDQLSQLVAIIGAVTSSKVGIHDVAATTGLGEDEIVATANKAKAQIADSLGSRSTKFLADLARANKGLSYANGGIRSGIYATKGGAVTFAEPSTGGEAFIPLGANKRRSALPVLNDVASRFGLGMRDAAEGRVVIIREQGPLMRDVNLSVGDRRNDRDLAREIENRFGYQMRRFARGGVAGR
ncbi:hypothetical protein ACFVWP_46975 [Streptomyces sp. NPDC058175]|uniref:hypothetical protein n=1 Tax=Streptomyces sp. NPDC058175 TaxID=3346367 RepID=UPI0036E91AF5